jgi:hypothetical protein
MLALLGFIHGCAKLCTLLTSALQTPLFCISLHLVWSTPKIKCLRSSRIRFTGLGSHSNGRTDVKGKINRSGSRPSAFLPMVYWYSKQPSWRGHQ